jgi:hypothetical protein
VEEPNAEDDPKAPDGAGDVLGPAAREEPLPKPNADPPAAGAGVGAIGAVLVSLDPAGVVVPPPNAPKPVDVAGLPNPPNAPGAGVEL